VAATPEDVGASEDDGGLKKSQSLVAGLPREGSEVIDPAPDNGPEPEQRDFFGAPIAEADAFDELTRAQMFQGRET